MSHVKTSIIFRRIIIMKKKIAMILTAAMVLGLVGCGQAAAPAATEPAQTEEKAEATEEVAEEADAPAAADGQTYTVGVCQLVEHPALDAATQGFMDAIQAELGDAVTFDVQNAQGDSNTCSTIINSFVSNNVNLIMANATPALQAAAAGTNEIPILGTSVTEYGVALDIDNFSGTVGGNISGTSDLAPLDKQADIFSELLPDVKKVGLVYCSAEANSQYQVDVVKECLEGKGIECQLYAFADSNDLSAVATSAANECEALYVPTDNTVASNAEIIQNICIPANIPVVAGE